MSATTKRDAASRGSALAEAWRKFDTARAALAVWVLALPPEAIDRDNVGWVQVAMRGICALLTEAREGYENAHLISGLPGMEPLFACSFADMAEAALWSYMEGGAAPAVADLAATANQVLAYLADFERSHGATRAGGVGPAAAAEGGAA